MLPPPAVDEFQCALNCSFDLNNNYPGVSNYIALEGENAIYYGKDHVKYNDPSYKYEEDGCNLAQTLDVECHPESYSSVLKYYVHYPDLPASTYASCPLPAFIVAHPGGFSDCSSIDGAAGLRTICVEMAKRGYVSFSIEYRRGRTKIGAPYVSAPLMLAYYRACQDFRGAIRSIIKRQVLFPGEHTFQIDINNIFLGGMSAGSFAALNAAYFQDQAMIEAVLPGITAAMGDLDINFYYGGASIPYLPSIKGVLNCWGNFYIPPANVSDIPGFFLQYNDYFPPAISFQGKLDKVAFPKLQGGLFPPNGSLARTESNCLPNSASYTLPITAIPPNYNIYACGAETLLNILKHTSVNQSCELYEDSSMAHGINDSNDNFGTPYTNPTDIYTYIARRTAIYFQALRLGMALSIGHNYFLDCENTRLGCTTGYSNACSSYITSI